MSGDLAILGEPLEPDPVPGYNYGRYTRTGYGTFPWEVS